MCVIIVCTVARGYIRSSPRRGARPSYGPDRSGPPGARTRAGRVLRHVQHATAVISPDGTAITGAWEGSADGDRWTRDFAVSYAKLG
jgi:hypothetical protein